jgi:hypothetical protein
MAGSGEKLDTDPQIGQPSCWGFVESPFSREQWLCPSLLTTSRKVVIRRPHEIRMVEGHTQTERGKRVTC